MGIHKKLMAVLAASVLATGCATVETESWQNCVMGGALLGGAAGAFVEGPVEVAIGAVAGGSAGGLLCGNADEKAVAPSAEPDTDNDGVVDSRDACPYTPEGELVDKKGCASDFIKEDIAEIKDECLNNLSGANGCTKALVLDGVNFYTGSATLTESAKAILLPIAVNHHTYNGDVNLLLSGHTDSQGLTAKNQGLSERRAESVRTFMITQGCDATKLFTVGYGESQPIADNTSSAGRASNRRVEMSIRN